MIRSHWLRLFAAGLVLSIQGVMSAQGADYPIEKIIKDWKDRQALVTSLHYEASGERIYLEGGFPSKDGSVFPSEDMQFPKKVKWLLDFKNNWAKKEVWESQLLISDRKYIPTFVAKLYDGEKIRIFTPREKNTSEWYIPVEFQPDLKIDPGSGRRFFFFNNDVPVFLANGFIAGLGRLPDPVHLSMPLAPDAFAVSGIGNMEGRECVIVKSKTRSLADVENEYWINPRRKHLIMRWSAFMKDNGDTPIIRADMHYRVSNAQWLLHSWRTDFYELGKKGRISESEQMTVTVFKSNQSTDRGQFQIKPRPQDIVEIGDDNKPYQVQDDGTFALATASSHKSWTPELLSNLVF